MTRAPIRIQLSRRKGWKKPEGAVVVARPTKWGNPFDWRKVPAHLEPRAWVVLQFDYWVSGLEAFPDKPAPPLLCTIRKELRGRDLACWCPLDCACRRAAEDRERMKTADDFRAAFDDTMREAMESFVEWAAENWTMSADEARTLLRPVACPESYARGYADGLAAAKDGLTFWLDEQL